MLVKRRWFCIYFLHVFLWISMLCNRFNSLISNYWIQWGLLFIVFRLGKKANLIWNNFDYIRIISIVCTLDDGRKHDGIELIKIRFFIERIKVQWVLFVWIIFLLSKHCLLNNVNSNKELCEKCWFSKK